MTKRYRVFKIDNMYGVSDDIANYTLAWDTSKTIMEGLCDLLNEQEEEIKQLKEQINELDEECTKLYFNILDKKNKKIKELKQELDMFNPVVFNDYRGKTVTLYKKEDTEKHESALYCYMVSFYNYSDSEFLPIFHEKRFTKQEFQEICNEIKKKMRENQENQWAWAYPDTFLRYAKEYGFREVDVLEVETIDYKVTSYGEYC